MSVPGFITMYCLHLTFMVSDKPAIVSFYSHVNTHDMQHITFIALLLLSLTCVMSAISSK